MLFNKVNKWLKNNHTCVLCGLHPANTFGICDDCMSDLPWSISCCHQCGRPTPFPTKQICTCCLKHAPAFDTTLATFRYVFPIDRLLPSIKYAKKTSHLGWLSSLMSEYILSKDLPLPDALVPVPMHPWDEIKRGYNQSSLLTHLISKQLTLPAHLGAIRKIKRTPHQKELNFIERQQNLIDCFRLNKPLPKRVAIVDDVMTTGSTVNEISRLLKNNGVETVDIWVLARTPE
ncbi:MULTISPECIES: ComF family protein [Nitrincola]|uniref:DNA utilization protein GntX n=1 Tax=Nitrincola nitratireducens TaxID=1229521 RepID=W9UWK9_9GAMM|nr:MULTISPECIES: ComF family protein [Nitrincola]EXJ11628.1 DNA utilization protein GntX [Nitrincola nitratireducens]